MKLSTKIHCPARHGADPEWRGTLAEAIATRLPIGECDTDWESLTLDQWRVILDEPDATIIEQSSRQCVELRARIEALGLSEVQFADFLGVSPKSVGAWVRDEVKAPGWVMSEVGAIENVVAQTVAHLVRQGEGAGESVTLYTYADGETFERSLDYMPFFEGRTDAGALLHRVAVARAGVELRLGGAHVEIVLCDESN